MSCWSSLSLQFIRQVSVPFIVILSGSGYRNFHCSGINRFWFSSSFLNRVPWFECKSQVTTFVQTVLCCLFILHHQQCTRLCRRSWKYTCFSMSIKVILKMMYGHVLGDYVPLTNTLLYKQHKIQNRLLFWILKKVFKRLSVSFE